MIPDALAAARLTRLLVSDAITARPRRAVLKRFPPGTLAAPNPSWVLTCERCAAVWAALAVTLLPRRLVRVLAIAETAAWLALRD